MNIRSDAPISRKTALRTQESLDRLPSLSAQDILAHLSSVKDGEDPHLITHNLEDSPVFPHPEFPIASQCLRTLLPQAVIEGELLEILQKQAMTTAFLTRVLAAANA